MDLAGWEERDEPESRLKNSAVPLAIWVGLALREVPAGGRLAPSLSAWEGGAMVWHRSGGPAGDQEAEDAPEEGSSGDRPSSVGEKSALRA